MSKFVEKWVYDILEQWRNYNKSRDENVEVNNSAKRFEDFWSYCIIFVFIDKYKI